MRFEALLTAPVTRSPCRARRTFLLRVLRVQVNVLKTMDTVESKSSWSCPGIGAGCWVLVSVIVGVSVGHVAASSEIIPTELIELALPIFRTGQLGVFIGQLSLYNQQHSSTR